ncbi:MAG TPA: adenylate/guanylate cyclase domain-containing protein [Acidimicrobiales bacterium]|nr:adenylate/guanylate cyclase domain-containing protein [Acidimicrobiales bacterium]
MDHEGGRSVHDELDELVARAAAATAGIDPDALVPITGASGLPAADEVPATTATRDELRRLTIMFSDLVGSTSLSGRLDPETYRTVLSAYKDACRRVIEDELDGHLVHTRGDGMLAVFGYPVAHEDDALRAVKAGMAIHRELADLPPEVHARAGDELTARVGVHRGLVYLERDSEELYGLAVNIAARVQEAAAPGTVAITDEVRNLVADSILTSPLEAREMKGVERAPGLHRVVAEHPRPNRISRRWPTPLVGRDAEVAALRDRLTEATASPRPLATVVVGDAGVGKSRLVGAFVDELPRGTIVLDLGGSPFHRHQGLFAIRELVCEWADVRRERPPSEQLSTLRRYLERQGLSHLLPLIAPVAGITPSAGYAPVEVEARLLEGQIADALHEVVCRWFDGHSGLVVVEDLHWLDDASRGVVARLVTSGPPGLLVLVTSRDDRALGAEAERLELGPLEPDECVQLIRHHDGELSPTVTAEVVSRSDGMPLFVEELVRARREDTALEAARPADDDGSIPGALYEPLAARLSSLGASRVVASAAAAIGRTVHLDLLARVSGVTADELDEALTQLMDGSVLEPDHGDGRTVRFRHELVRLVAYELEPPSGRERFHALAAHALTAGGIAAGADWSLIAEHHERSGAHAAAAVALEHAADDARQRGSLEEARANFDRALEAVALAPPGEERDRLEVRLRLARAFIAVSAEGFGSEHATADLRGSLGLSISQPEGVELYRTLIAVWGYYINRSDLDRAWTVSTALRPLSAGSRRHMLPTNEAGFGMIEFHRGSFVESARRLQAAVADIDEIGADETSVPDAWTMPLDPLASMYVHNGLTLGWVGDLEAAAGQMAAARHRCDRLPFPLGPFSLGYVLLLEGSMHVHLGDRETGRTCAEEVVELSTRHGFDAWLFWGSILLRTLEAAEAGPERGPELAAAALMSVEMFHALGVRAHSATMCGSVAGVLLELGDREGALAAADRARELVVETGSRASESEILRVRARAGPDDEVEAGLLAALARAEEQGAVIGAVRIATDLVVVGGETHRATLDRALARVVSDTGAPVLDAAREVLAASAG